MQKLAMVIESHTLKDPCAWQPWVLIKHDRVCVTAVNLFCQVGIWPWPISLPEATFPFINWQDQLLKHCSDQLDRLTGHNLNSMGLFFFWFFEWRQRWECVCDRKTEGRVTFIGSDHLNLKDLVWDGGHTKYSFTNEKKAYTVNNYSNWPPITHAHTHIHILE